MSVEIVPAEYQQIEPEVNTPQEMALRLADMKQRLSLVQTFFKEVMVRDQDYGIIPGTDKPTLLKPGAEKLCEFYGFAITVKKLEETADRQTGYYRAIVTVALVSKRTGATVAEGVGEANTLEGRYRWRWLPEWKLPAGVDKAGLKVEERRDKNGRPYLMYRVENEDPWALWNTVLKMAKKRALIDAVLSATRSSGIFTQDVEDLQEWIDGSAPVPEEPRHNADNAALQHSVARAEPPKTPKPKQNGGAMKALFAAVDEWATKAGFDPEQAKQYAKEILRARYGVSSCSDLTPEQWTEAARNRIFLIKALEQKYISDAQQAR